jgi:L-ascorbate metabolism protein UlaG (beta-lactamase superfamily)
MAASSVTLTLIGGPTVLIEVAGARLLTDPGFDPPGSYDARGTTLVKTVGPAMRPAELGEVDVVLLSHDQHFDNLDRQGREFLPRARRVLTTEPGAARLGPPAEGLAPWQSVQVATPRGARLGITATPARHGPVGIEPLSGAVTGFVVQAERAGPALYVSGDTVWYAGVAEVARRFDVQLAILFTGAARPRGAFRMTMDCNEAIEAAHAFAAARIVAVHNQGWAHFTETQEELARAFAVVGLEARLMPLTPGTAVTVQLGGGERASTP